MEPAERLIVLGYSTVLFVVIGLSAFERTQPGAHKITRGAVSA